MVYSSRFLGHFKMLILYPRGKGKLGKCVQMAIWSCIKTTLAESKRTRSASGTF